MVTPSAPLGNTLTSLRQAAAADLISLPTLKLTTASKPELRMISSSLTSQAVHSHALHMDITVGGLLQHLPTPGVGCWHVAVRLFICTAALCQL